jgi:transposase
VNLDEMGPEAAKSFRGRQLIRPQVPVETVPQTTLEMFAGGDGATQEVTEMPTEPEQTESGGQGSPEAVLVQETLPTAAARQASSVPEPTGMSASLRQQVPTTVGSERRVRGQRAKQEIDYGRRGKGYIFGAFRPAMGDALTEPYDSRSAANWADFLEKVDSWLPSDFERVYGILDSLNAHRATDALLFSLAHPRWEFVFQPKYAAYLNLIEPWWKVLRSLALKGRRFETWEEVCQAVREATAYWNAHRHPFVWGRRRRHQPRRRSGVGLLPKVA